MSMPSVIFLESNTTGTGSLFATTCRDLGYRPLVITSDPSRYSFLESERIEWVLSDTSDNRRLVKLVSELLMQTKIAGVYSTSEYFIEGAAFLSAQFGLPGPDHRAVGHFRNKWHQRLKLRELGFLVPKFRLVQCMKEVIESFQSIGLPAVLKPTCGSGSTGVRLCRTREEVKKHAQLLLQRDRNERGMPVKPELLIEEYIVGPEYSVEVFHGEVVGITRKHTTPEPYFVEMGHDFPASIPMPMREALVETVCHILRCMKLTWGPTHTEVRWSSLGPVIVEVNPRLAGGFIPELIRIATGIDLIRATLAAVVGRSSALCETSHQYAAIRFLATSEQGTLSSVNKLNRPLRVPGVVEAQLYPNSGRQCQIHHDFRDRIGHVIATGSRPEEAADCAELGLAGLRAESDACEVQTVE